MFYKRYCSVCRNKYKTENNCQKFCSLICQKKNKSIRSAITQRKNIKTQERKTYTQFCSACGIDFIRKSNNAIYCSNKCRNRVESEYKNKRKIADEDFRKKGLVRAKRLGNKYRKILMDYLHEIKSKSSCLLCGESHIACLSFHHRDPSTKIGTMSYFVNNRCSLNKLKEEINKCDILCENCHRKEHYNKRKTDGFSLVAQ